MGVPFNNLVFEFIDKSFALLNFLSSIINFTLKCLKNINRFRLLNLHNWHFILQGLDEFLFFVSRAVTVHFSSTAIDFLKIGLCNFKSFSEFVVFNFEESGSVLDVLKDQEVVELAGEGI